MSNNNLHVSDQTCFDVIDTVPSRLLVTRMTQCLFCRFARSFGCPPLCLSILPPTSFLRCATKNWFMTTKATTLRVEIVLLSCTKAWCFCYWDNGGMRLQAILQITPHILWNPSYTMHKKSHDVLNYTTHTKMLILEAWRQTKVINVTLITLTFAIFETLFPFHFMVSHLCNW